MEMQRKYTDVRPGTSESKLLTVGRPLPHDGIGNALRATFRPVHNALPDDMLDLLAMLDRH